MRRLICKKPFEWMEISANPGKQVYLCCQGWLPISVGYAEQTPIKEIWQSKTASKIRQSVIDGSFKYCKKTFCRYLEGGEVPDQLENPLITVGEHTYERYKKAVEEPIKYLPEPKTLNAAYDYSCNLSCPSCRKEIRQDSKEQRENNNQFIEATLEEIGNKLQLLYVTGSGDPFGSRHFWDLLQSDITNKYPNLRFRIHTNAQLLTPNRWQRIKHLHHKIDTLEISIDGASAETYEENRRPGKWIDLLERMNFVSEIIREQESIKLTVSFVIQANNYFEMEKFVELGKTWEANTIQFSCLNNWGTFSAAEYLSRAIHVQYHKEYSRFIEALRNPVFDDYRVVFDFDCEKILNSASQKIDVVQL